MMFLIVPSGSQITENQLDSLIRFRTWRFFPGIRPKMASRVAMLSFSARKERVCWSSPRTLNQLAAFTTATTSTIAMVRAIRAMRMNLRCNFLIMVFSPGNIPCPDAP